MAKQKVGKGGSKKIGRSKREPKHVRYNNHQQRMKNKIRRILKSNGEEYLKWWLENINGKTARKPTLVIVRSVLET